MFYETQILNSLLLGNSLLFLKGSYSFSQNRLHSFSTCIVPLSTRAEPGQFSHWLRPTGTICGICGCHCAVKGNLPLHLCSKLGCMLAARCRCARRGRSMECEKGKGIQLSRARATSSLTLLSPGMHSFPSRLSLTPI